MDVDAALMRYRLPLLFAALIASPAQARDRVHVDVPAGTLGNAITILSAQAGISVSIESNAQIGRAHV